MQSTTETFEGLRKDFPVLNRRVRDDKKLVYFDNAATTQKPNEVNKLAKQYIAVEKIGKPQDLINFINLIISAKNNFMNGSIVSIDGGMK